MDILEQSAVELHSSFVQGDLTALDITTAFLQQMEHFDPTLQAMLFVDRDGALATADEQDNRRARGMDKGLGPLAGVPVVIKDILCTKDMPSTAGSRMLENFIPPYDATLVHSLKQAGAILLGKTNLDEFGMGSSNENSAFHPTCNPWDLECSPGGSSGGSAAAVAARFAPVAIGTDTGGSIRQPAAMCGIAGLKPTYGRVSRFGLIAYASSLDQAGPMCHSVRDLALVLEVIAGRCMKDLTTLQQRAPKFQDQLAAPMGRMRLGVPVEYRDAIVVPELKVLFESNLKKLQDSLHVELIDVSLPHTAYSTAAYYLLATSEASSNLARYDGIRYGHSSEHMDSLLEMYENNRAQGFGEEVKRRILLGTFALREGYAEAYYKKAVKIRQLIRDDFDTAFQQVDALLAPVCPERAFRLDDEPSHAAHRYAHDVLTVGANLAGIPALSVPSGFDSNGLPVGMQILGPHFEEGKLLHIAWQLENVFAVRHHLPALIGGDLR